MENYRYTHNINQPEDRFTRAVSILIIIVMIYLILYVVTFSWFGESKLVDAEFPLVIGDIELVVENYDYNNILLEPSKIYETQTTIKTKELQDQTGISAYVRIKLETDKTLNETDEYLLSPVFEYPESWVLGTDGWHYYIGYISNTLPVEFNLQAGRLTVAEIGLPFEITLSIHAIQKDYLDLTDLNNTDSELYEWRQAPQEFLDYIDNEQHNLFNYNK